MNAKLLTSLKSIASQFDAGASERKTEMLKASMREIALPTKRLVEYHDLLLFLCAHPSSLIESQCSERALLRLSNFLRNIQKKLPNTLENSGLPFTTTTTKFSHDFLCWIEKHKHCHADIDSEYAPTLTYNDVLKITLPTFEKIETSSGWNNKEILDALRIQEKDKLSFLLAEHRKLDDQPLIKDLLFDSLDIYVTLQPRDKYFSRSFNRIPIGTPYCHTERLTSYHFSDILNTPLPNPKSLSNIQREELVNVVKNTMALAGRETDPATFMEPASLRLFELERGNSIALFGMTAQRQLPIESYIGFTLFKNGLPAAYGGAWVVGERSRFGINIFEAFRGGESGYVMSQILRVYKQTFKISYIEIEAYQFGLDNPDGIKSGAFWFYYKHGFRPIDSKLKVLAEKESLHIKSRKGYRSNESTLIKFTASNMAIQLGPHIPIDIPDMALVIGKMIAKTFKGNRTLACDECTKWFGSMCGTQVPQTDIAVELSLLARAYKLTDLRVLQTMAEMMHQRIHDDYQYQDLLSEMLPLLRKNNK